MRSPLDLVVTVSAPTATTDVITADGIEERMVKVSCVRHQPILTSVRHATPPVKPSERTAVAAQVRRAIDAELSTRLQRHLDTMGASKRQEHAGALVKRYLAARCPPTSESQGQGGAFQSALTDIVTARDPGLFDTLLHLKQSMAEGIAQLLQARQRDETALTARHQMELSAVGGRKEYAAPIVARQKEEMDILNATWASELEALNQKQRQEYRQMVMTMHADLNRQSQPSSPKAALTQSDTPPDSKKTQSITQESQSSLPLAPVQQPIDPVLFQRIGELQEMGFSREQAVCALHLAEKSLDRAIVLLLEEPAKIDQGIADGLDKIITEQPVPASVPRQTTPPLPQRPESSASSNASIGDRWSPINFIEKQINKNAAAKSNLKRLTSWFDKARAQIEDLIDTDQRSPTDPKYQHLMESFTITLGSQVRQTQNLRLIVSRMGDFFGWPEDELTQRGLRAQTTATLYSRYLSGIVVLVNVEQWQNYKRGLGPNRELFDACRRSTELHFEDVEKQLECAEKELVDARASVAEGAVFVTRHSNLPMVHVVFHLIVSPQSFMAELNQRSPVMAGLKNVLRIASRHDVQNISLPFLFLPDESFVPSQKALSQPTLHKTMGGSASVNAATAFIKTLPRRAEVVLKCTKGFLLEISRTYGRQNASGSGASGGEDLSGSASSNAATIQFVMPPWLGKDVEPLFDQFRQMLRSIYRTL